MAPSGTVALKSFQSFVVSEGLLAKTVEAVKAGEKEARSSGDIQSFEVLYRGLRMNICIGKLMVIPPSIADSLENFPVALLYGTLVRQFGGEEMAELISKKIGDDEFDEYSKADLTAIKNAIFKNEETGKFESLILFAPAWMNKREYVGFKFTKDDVQLADLLRHLVFASYYNPAVSSAFNALMTDVSTDKTDVTDITPKLTQPALAESLLREYPNMEKVAKSAKKIFLTAKTADAITQDQMEPAEINVFDALNQAINKKPKTVSVEHAASKSKGDYASPEEMAEKTADRHHFQHDAEIVVSQVLNGGFMQLWDNYGDRPNYSVKAMLSRTAEFLREKGREDMAQIFDAASQIQYTLHETPRNNYGDIDEAEYEAMYEELNAQFDPLETKFYDLWESNYEEDPSKRRDWDTYFGEETKNMDSPIFRSMQQKKQTSSKEDHKPNCPANYGAACKCGYTNDQIDKRDKKAGDNTVEGTNVGPVGSSADNSGIPGNEDVMQDGASEPIGIELNEDGTPKLKEVAKEATVARVKGSIFAKLKTANTITLANPVQVALYKGELIGQMSDGLWENSAPRDHWRSMVNANVMVGQPGMDFTPRRTYGFNQLVPIIGDRMLWLAKAVIAYPNLKVDSMNHDIEGVMSHQKDIANTKDEWIQKGITRILAATGETDIQSFIAKVNGVPYNENNLRRDLYAIQKVVNAKYKGVALASTKVARDIRVEMNYKGVNFLLTTWAERDNFVIDLTIPDSDKEVLHLVDQDAIGAIEDGFISRKNPDAMIESAIKYAEELGLLSDVFGDEGQGNFHASLESPLPKDGTYRNAASERSRQQASKHEDTLKQAGSEFRKRMLAQEDGYTNDAVLNDVLDEIGPAPLVDLPGQSSGTQPEATVPAPMKSQQPEETKGHAEQPAREEERALENSATESQESQSADQNPEAEKTADGVEGDVSEAKSELDFTMNDLADHTLNYNERGNPDHFAAGRISPAMMDTDNAAPSEFSMEDLWGEHNPAKPNRMPTMDEQERHMASKKALLDIRQLPAELQQVLKALQQIAQTLENTLVDEDNEIPAQAGAHGKALSAELDKLHTQVRELADNIQNRKYGAKHASKIANAVKVLQAAAAKFAEPAPQGVHDSGEGESDLEQARRGSGEYDGTEDYNEAMQRKNDKDRKQPIFSEPAKKGEPGAVKNQGGHWVKEKKFKDDKKEAGDRKDDVPVSQGETESTEQPVSDLSNGAPEAHDVPQQVDSKTAAKPLPNRNTDPGAWHQLQIAMKSLKMPPAMVGVMGGPSQEEATKILAEYGLVWDEAKSKAVKQGKTADAMSIGGPAGQGTDSGSAMTPSTQMSPANGSDGGTFGIDLLASLAEDIARKG